MKIKEGRIIDYETYFTNTNINILDNKSNNYTDDKINNKIIFSEKYLEIPNFMLNHMIWYDLYLNMRKVVVFLDPKNCNYIVGNINNEEIKERVYDTLDYCAKAWINGRSPRNSDVSHIKNIFLYTHQNNYNYFTENKKKDIKLFIYCTRITSPIMAYAMGNSLIVLNYYQYWNDQIFTNVMCHEFGHILGFSHNEQDSSSIMYYRVGYRFTPSDVYRINYLKNIINNYSKNFMNNLEIYDEDIFSLFYNNEGK